MNLLSNAPFASLQLFASQMIVWEGPVNKQNYFFFVKTSSFPFKFYGVFTKLKGKEKFCDHSWERCDLADFGSFFALCFQVCHMNQMPSSSWFCTCYNFQHDDFVKKGASYTLLTILSPKESSYTSRPFCSLCFACSLNRFLSIRLSEIDAAWIEPEKALCKFPNFHES